MSVKVSVVVPVYNTGRYIEPCIDSILGQSLPPDEYEAIFVDDGSTDATPARLDRLAAEHANVKVIHIPNSGWPGRPRNVGVDAASGEFIQFVDHDDRLTPDALRRMYDYGVANDADMVVGKMAGRGRPVPRELFRTNRPRASVLDSPLIDSLTPHKMFRRSFLETTGLRFPEGRRRLEDHVFVTEALLRARNVSVLGDHVCYIHTRRNDTSNAGLQLFDPVSYFVHLREALDVVERYTAPGPVRDRLYRRWWRTEMIERMRGERMLAWPKRHREQLFAEIRKVALERFGPGVTAGLQPIQQVVAALILADLPNEALALARWERRVAATTRLTELRWVDGTLRIACEARLTARDAPLTLRRDGRDVLLDPPLGRRGRAALRAHGVDLRMRPGSIKADIVLRQTGTSAEYFLPVATEHSLTGSDDRLVLTIRSSATVDPATAAAGRPPPAGTWNLRVRVNANGWSRETGLQRHRDDGFPAVPHAARLGEPPRLVVPYWRGPGGGLAIDVQPRAARVAALLDAVRPADARVAGGRLRIDLPVHVPAAGAAEVRYAVPGSDEAEIRPAMLDTGGTLAADLPATPPPYAGIDLALVPERQGTTVFAATQLGLVSRPDGAQVVVGRPAEPPAPQGVRRRVTVRTAARRAVRKLVGERGWQALRRARHRMRAARRYAARRGAGTGTSGTTSRT